MEIGNYIIVQKTGGSAKPLCLGADTNRKLPIVASFDPTKSATTWLVAPVAGMGPENGLYLQHLDSQLCLRFNGGGENLTLAALDPFDSNFYIRLDNVGDGFAAVSLVIDAHGNSPSVGNTALGWRWNGGDNQRWRFVSTSLYAGLPQ